MVNRITQVRRVIVGTPINRVNAAASRATLNLAGDSSTTGSLILADSSLTFIGGTGLTSYVTGNTVQFDLDSTSVSPGTYGSGTAIPTFTVDAQGRITSVSTTGIASVPTNITINGDSSTTDTISLIDSDLTFVGSTGISSVVTDNTLTITLEDTNVSPGSYGSATQIPTFTVDQQGRLTAASVANVATTLGTIGDTGTGSVSLLDSSFTITGGTNLNTVASGTTITVNLDSSVSGLSSLSVDNITINGNTISSTDGSNTLYIDPAPTDSAGGRLIIRGDLQVDGTTTTVNSTTLSINDKNIILADSAADSSFADGAGITIAGANATILYNATTDTFDFNKAISEIDGGTY